jgi:bifunctional DNase/RNase
MTVAALTFDDSTQAPILLLRSTTGSQVLPIFIGMLEAHAIGMHLDHTDLGRPLTHDLLLSRLEGLGGSVVRLEVRDLKDSTYYASLFVEQGGRAIELDCRPSDGIALALRAGAPIHVREEVLAKSVSSLVSDSSDELPELASDDDRWLELLENMSAEEFGKYKM